ncbi:MAG: hypothetical protein ACYC91_12675 [Solirubrobacteraceae bacterium]
MTAQTVSADPAAAHEPPARPEPSGPIRRFPEIATAIVLLAISTVIVVWARTRPGFDPYGWLVWGHQTLTASLDTNAAPSWKPLPYLFTLPFALAGHYQMWLWMIASVAMALAGVVFAGRIAYRLTAAPSGRRWAGIVAASFAGVALLGIRDYWHYILSAQSDPLIVSLCLGAVDAHLSRRPRWVFALGALASLGRPEVWPFLGLWSLWAWRALPELRTFIAAGVVLIAALWFGIPAITSRSAFVAGSNALGSGRALHTGRVYGTVDRFLDMHETGLELAALLSVVWAAVRRDRMTLTLAAIVAVWVVLEIAFSLHGWPGLPRYMFGAGGLMVVIAAVGIGRLLADPPALPSAVGLAGAAVSVAIVASLIPAALSRERTEHRDLNAQRVRTREIGRLATLVSRYGAPRLRGCGEPLTRLEYQTILAWNLGVNVARVGFKYGPAIARHQPILLFTPHSRGWKLQALHQHSPSCRRLPR